jgi:1,4-dihydroxy-2-naphthoate octaprenyltransferase
LPLNVWIQAARLRTLPLAIAGTVAGNMLAYAETGFISASTFIISVLTAVFLQVLSNYANDYGDFKNGADTNERTDRVMASGAVTEAKMKLAIGILAALCLISGISLLAVSISEINNSFWIFLALGIAGMLAAYFYTAGKNPYGYAGFGDLSVFIFFGILSVSGSYFLQAKTLHSPVWWTAAAIGLLSVAVLNINNIRDISSDKSKNKMTIPVRIGYKTALIYQVILLIGATECFLVYSYHTDNVFILLNFFLFLAFFAMHFASLRKARERPEYNRQLKFLSLITFALSLFLCITEMASSQLIWD